MTFSKQNNRYKIYNKIQKQKHDIHNEPFAICKMPVHYNLVSGEFVDNVHCIVQYMMRCNFS